MAYKEITNCSIEEIKRFALTIALKKNDYYFIKKINVATSAFQIKRLLFDNQDIATYFLQQCIQYFKNVESIDEAEKILIFMNQLIPNACLGFDTFKTDLYWWVMNQIDTEFRYEHYAIIRHLKKMNKKQRKVLLEGIWQLLGKDSLRYHECCMDIYLVEEDFENAYHHLPFIKVDEKINPYKRDLLEYDTQQYKKHFPTNQNNLSNRIKSFVEKIMVTCF